MNDIIEKLRKDFPFLTYDQEKEPLIYCDNAATSQKPRQVIDRIAHYYAHENAPVHRGIYSRAENITKSYEQARKTIASYLGAFDDEIIFTKGTTEGINFIASTWAESKLIQGDEIILTELEHHSNILPWQRIAKKKGIILKYVKITSNGDLDYDSYISLLSEKTKLVAFTHCSNAIGTYIDASFIIDKAKSVGAKVLLDVAQSVAHRKINVQNLKPDFLVFSGHKVLGPTGIGILYISRLMHKEVEPYQLGGGMVFQVQCYDSSWLQSPHRYEAGTPPIAQAIGFAEAINYIKQNINFDQLRKYEAQLCTQLIEGLKEIKGIKILGPRDQLMHEGHIVSFSCNKMHPHDIAAYLNSKNIAVRAGNHCAQPLYSKLKLQGSVRISFYFYNTQEEIKKIIFALNEII